MPRGYIPLHLHTHYSLLDGLSKIPDLVALAKKYQMSSLAITDHGVLYGAIEFYEACKAEGINPIIGEEVYIAPYRLQDKRPKMDEKYYHLILLAKNETGYRNLLKLTSIAQLEGYYYKPRIDLEVLEKYHEGLIATTACIGGEVAHAATAHGYEKAKRMAEKYRRIFGEDFYLEVQYRPTLPEQKIINDIYYKLSGELGIPVVATNDSHYLKLEDNEAQDILVCIQTKKHLDDKDRLCMMGENLALVPPEEMEAWFSDHPEALENTHKIAEKCRLTIELGKLQFPEYPLPEGRTPAEELRYLCNEGMKKRYPETNKKILDRLEYELDIIAKTGFASYFLIVQDFVNWAKAHGIVVGPGRGSAAGSIVSYLTGITDIDPLLYDLYFERFLNPARISMPDIDLDFADTRRDEVIHYVEEKYGKDHVAQIITFGTIAARAAIRDAGRVLKIPYSFCDQLAKLIPMGMTLQESMERVPEIKKMYESEDNARRVLDNAKRIEGVARHASRHACGVIITRDSLVEHVPLQHASRDDSTIISQYSLHAVEDLGLLKIDFLGLKNLTIIETTLKLIEKTTGEKVDISKISLHDKKTFALLQKAQTTGVFQLESSGMRRYLRELKPTELEDIIAMVALYRPGPMEWIPQYIEGKHKKMHAEYLHPKLQPILEKTYGVPLYQEQLMEIAQSLGGFSLAEADILRKAIGKKISKLLKQQKEKFIAGCLKNTIEKRIAEEVFQFMEPFARYGFNRSHAACYALIAYQTAYLKANYSAQFMTALLTSDYGDTDRIAIEVSECRDLGIEVLPPNINESYTNFTLVKESLGECPRIRFGLAAVKNIGTAIVEAMVQERKNNEKYKNLEDFLRRVRHKDLNKKSLESLAKSGALDEFAERNQIMQNIDQLLLYIKNISQEMESGQINLFSELPAEHGPQLRLRETPPASQSERLSWEKQLLGLYISSHPMDPYQEMIPEDQRIGNILAEHLRSLVDVVGVVTKVHRVFTRSGDTMFFITLEDKTGNIEAIVFPKLKESSPELWEEGKILRIEGELSDKENQFKILASSAQLFKKEDRLRSRVMVHVPSKIKKDTFSKLRMILDVSSGPFLVTLMVGEKQVPTKKTISEDAIRSLRVLFGEESIKML